MENRILKPLGSVEFREKVKTRETEKKLDLVEYFKKYIDTAIDFAIGPFYWFIPDNSGPKTVAASSSFSVLTPYSVEELIEKSISPYFFAENIMEEDRLYVLSAIEVAMRTSEEYRAMGKKTPKFNIYCRMLNANWDFVWRLIQFPDIYFNSLGQAEGIFALVTDLSHFPYIKKPMMTIIDNENKTNQYFSVAVETQFFKPINLPKITSREQQILKLIVKGLNNPLISKELGIAINTVQNHKRNLREKTNTKTSAELIAFVMENNLV